MFAFFSRHLEAQIRALPGEGVAARVRDRVLRGTGLEPSLENVASALQTPPRTLQRQLAAEGTSLRALAEEARRARAIAASIAGRMGSSSARTSSRGSMRAVSRR